MSFLKDRMRDLKDGDAEDVNALFHLDEYDEFLSAIGEDLVVDPELHDLIPPLTKEEYEGLERSIIEEGCREPLIVWGKTIVDGHNRYEICKDRGIPFKTTQKEFGDRNDVIIWMIHNQFGRRNLNKYQRAKLALRLKPAVAAKAKEKMTSTLVQNTACPNLDKRDEEAYHTNEELAKTANIGRSTFAKVAKIEEKATPEVKQKLDAGKISIDQAYSAIRLQEKKEEIANAEKAIHEEATAEYKPYLTVGNSIGYIPAEKYDLLLTDPPYSTDVDDINKFVDDWLYNALDNVKPTGFAYIFIGAYPEEVRSYLNAKTPEHISLCQLLTWTYKNTLGNNPKDRYKQNYQVCLFYRGIEAPDLNCPLTSEQWAVQEINAPDGRQGDRYHAWQKPMEIAERFVRHSTQQGMTVFDPFACTGTFLLAATKLGRKAYGFEIDPANAEIAFSRGCVKSE